jgi:hypothetical protein
MIALGGLPQDGKSSLLRFLSYHIAIDNDDAVIIYFTIDDSLPKMLPAMVSLASNGRFTINEIMFPLKHGLINDQNVRNPELDASWKSLESIDNIVILDSTSGNTLSSISLSIEKIMNIFPNRKPVVLLDNMFNIKPEVHGGVRENIMESSRIVKLICDDFDIPIITTVQFKKTVYEKEYPQESDIADTIRVAYDTDQIWLIKNELNLAGNPANVTNCWERDGKKKPIVEINVIKNKTPGSAWLGQHILYFDPEYNMFAEKPATKSNKRIFGI